MQQVLKSRAFLHNYNSAATLRGAFDCGECDAPSRIEPAWAKAYTLKQVALRLFAMFVLAQCAYGALEYFK